MHQRKPDITAASIININPQRLNSVSLATTRKNIVTTVKITNCKTNSDNVTVELRCSSKPKLHCWTLN
jgi:hypothetical protein